MKSIQPKDPKKRDIKPPTNYTNILHIYRPQRSCGQGYVFTRVCDSVHGGGGLPQCMLGYHPPGSRPPGIRSMSGRYASYWNAFLYTSLVRVNALIMQLLVRKKVCVSPQSMILELAHIRQQEWVSVYI